ncbi:response regulator [Photobacterium sp. SDRW27]|uniref:response regulator n=1 Tax=Photobacterium obscurum TaxID=2829490 RepID=UPI002244110D|nr:response regulator [Photobacterium obscurum]MCW8327905.1 response regulator [Photobacterium obscurum]
MVRNQNILICDDSPMVHKAMSRILSGQESLTLHFAHNGREGLECLTNHDIDVMFLDLTMPVMDGFEVLHLLPVRAHETKVIILSADVQKQAMERCVELGAHYFLPKPFNIDQVITVFHELGVHLITDALKENRDGERADDYILTFKEVANVALGRGAAIISDHFGEFIKMPLPNVARLCSGELAMAINDIKQQSESVAIAQRFVGGGIHGEALVCLRGKEIAVFGERLGFSQMDEHKSEIVIDIANLMVSSFLVALSEQMNIPFSVRQPIVLEDYMVWSDTEHINTELFTVEYTYQAESLDLECDVLFMMDSGSTHVIKKIMDTLH